MPKQYGYMESEIGLIEIECSNAAIYALRFVTEKSQVQSNNSLITKAIEQLTQYFQGTRVAFDLPLAVQGSAFQLKVWQALSTIAYGEVKSYQDIAEQIGSPKAVRAVGAANGKNPISIIVPCHRVIGKSGKLTGYSGGIERKQALLRLEQQTVS